MSTLNPLRQAEIAGLEPVHRGKVRDLFHVGDHLLMVSSDRVSAFDVILPDLIPRKGEVLNRISEFWFRKFASRARHHLITTDIAAMPAPLPDHPELAGRSSLCRRVQPILAEFVVRGYLAGSGWKEYQRLGSVCAIDLPSGLRLCDQLPEPLFTPSTKAPQGEHDANISFDQLCDEIGHDRATRCRDLVMSLYQEASAWAGDRGILLADTKVELAEDDEGIVIIDELFTPDSSRFWPRDDYEPGRNQRSFDKQIIRDYLETLDWDKTHPGPQLPAEIVARTQDAYLEIYQRLTGSPLDASE